MSNPMRIISISLTILILQTVAACGATPSKKTSTQENTPLPPENYSGMVGRGWIQVGLCMLWKGQANSYH